MSYIEQLLIKLLYAAILKDFLEKMEVEERAMYDRGKENSDDRHPDSIYMTKVNEGVMQRVHEEIDVIGYKFSDRLLKVCELSGFPPELCDPKDPTKSVMCFIVHLTNMSDRLRKADVASGDFLDLLDKYAILRSVFNMDEVMRFVSDLIREIPMFKTLELDQKIEPMINVDSPVFDLMQIRASMYLAQTEQDIQFQREFFTKLSLKLQSISIGMRLGNPEKYAYVHYIFLELISFRARPIWQTLPEKIDIISRCLVTFAEEIVKTTTDKTYGKIQTSFPASSSRLPHRANLLEFLRVNLKD